jgi:hypothetical protein
MPITPAAPTSGGYQIEWEDAELVEELEALRSRVRDLEAERDQLRTDLRVAQLWVKELAIWLEEAQARTGGTALQPSGLALAPETLLALRQWEAAPTPWRRFASLGAIVLAPWATLGLVAWLLATRL